MTLDLFTFLTKGGADYAEYIKSVAEQNLSGKHDINWKYVESLNLDRHPQGFQWVGKTGGEGEHSAMKHALAIHEALKHIDAEYVLLTDVDVAIVYKGWDDIIIKKLNDFDCFGGAQAKTKSKYVRNRYKEFPKANFFAFRSDVLKKTELDFRPFYKEKNGAKHFILKNPSKKQRKIVKVKFELACDIGWQLPFIFYRNKLTHDYMPCYFMDSPHSKLPFVDEENEKICMKNTRAMEEWHYKNELFAVHKKFSRYHDLYDDSGGRGIAWKERIDLYLKRRDENEKEK